jgi:hypothetical protein
MLRAFVVFVLDFIQPPDSETVMSGLLNRFHFTNGGFTAAGGAV